METLHEFNDRVRSFQINSVPDEPRFGLPVSLQEKVAQRTGALRPYYGNTVAYLLSDGARDLVGSAVNELYSRFGESLSLPLPLETAHVTLHDLYASPDRAHVARQIDASTAIVVDAVAKARAIGTIYTECTAVFNLMDTSVAIGLRAADQDEHRKLQAARHLFDKIVPSGQYTPHITLAYYRPSAPILLPPEEFRDALKDLTEGLAGAPVVLEPDRLHAMCFQFNEGVLDGQAMKRCEKYSLSIC